MPGSAERVLAALVTLCLGLPSPAVAHTPHAPAPAAADPWSWAGPWAGTPRTRPKVVSWGASRPDPRAPAGPRAVPWPEGRTSGRAVAGEARGEASGRAVAEEARGEASGRGGEGGRTPPAPKVVRKRTVVRVAVGFSPEAPGTREERRLVAQLEASARAATGLDLRVRRLRAGAPPPREICREGREDLVVVVGYVPGRAHPVLLPHDCRLDRPLPVRGKAAARDPRLFEALWAEHERLVAEGVRPRRRWVRIGPKARAALIGTTVVLVLGAAVAILVVGALRKERVVLKVHP